MSKDLFENYMIECRQGYDKFHWYLTIFSGAVLTVLFDFIKDNSPINDNLSILFLKILIWSLIVIMIFSATRNYISHSITSLFAQSERDWDENKKEAVKSHNRAATLTKIRAVMGYTSLGLSALVLILIAITVNRIFF